MNKQTISSLKQKLTNLGLTNVQVSSIAETLEGTAKDFTAGVVAMAALQSLGEATMDNKLKITVLLN